MKPSNLRKICSVEELITLVESSEITEYDAKQSLLEAYFGQEFPDETLLVHLADYLAETLNPSLEDYNRTLAAFSRLLIAYRDSNAQ